MCVNTHGTTGQFAERHNTLDWGRTGRRSDEMASIRVKARDRTNGPSQRSERTKLQSEEEIVAALIAKGKLIGPLKRGRFEPFKPIKMRGKPLSQAIIEDRR
jgi:hypothetical protein